MFQLASDAMNILGARSRREWLRLGGLSSLGLSLGGLLKAQATTGVVNKGASFGRAKSCILLYLAGGPPQHETFDPKPDAPIEIRGDFKPIPTSVPGVHFSELLPRTARIADKMAVIRSMSTDNNSHTASGYWMLTGYEHPAKAEIPANPSDWPCLASVVGALKPSQRSAFSSVILPEILHNDNAPPSPGQFGGFMGHAWNPHLFECDPSAPRFEIDGLKLPVEVGSLRLDERVELLRQFDRHFASVTANGSAGVFDRVQQQAFDVVRNATTRAAFELEREPSALRDRYGRTKWGQSVLLARRLVEAGVRLVQVNWPRERDDMATGFPVWDTHKNNSARLRDVLCPQFDISFSSLVTDLHERGLLGETLVIAMGEFGRTPKINTRGGRDHWGHCFSLAVAGAGIEGGQVIGASDKAGGYPVSRPLRPQDLAATIFHLMGIDSNGDFLDPFGRPRPLTNGGTPIRELVGV
ncbi:MAG: DUF1501 domain-containing protein [Pedosphaera sp.]|nr:DUF1501 domain-containing protein [Pedosphaera sp.]MST00839.1 DUF1501 domain-containing protein [Pedosphaera sp.]